MRILQLCPRMPYPLTDGGAIGIFNITKSLAELGHEITLLTYPLETQEATAEAVLALSKFADVRLVSKTLPSRNFVLLRTVLKGAYPIERREMPEMYELIRKTCKEKQFDVVHVDHCHMGRYGLWVKQEFALPILLREHNIEFQIYERFALAEKSLLKRAVARIHGKRLRVEETTMLTQFDRVAAISDEDRQLIKHVAPSARVGLIPAGVDLEYFKPEHKTVKSNSILFVGALDWDPNYDALLYFLRSIFPLILKRNREAVLTVVGSNTERIQPEIGALGNSVCIMGRVPDIRDYFGEAAVVVVPLRIGGGIRIKILEAFAMGKALVATSIGVEGIEATNGEHLLVRDTPESFAEAVDLLLRNDAMRETLGASAQSLVHSTYDWKGIAKRFTDLYISASETRSRVTEAA